MTGVASPGAWLLDMLRPRPYVPPPLPPEGDAAREGHAYARAAVAGVLGELARAVQGQRNEAAFRAACRLVELARAGWAGLHVEQVRGAFLSVCAGLNTDGTFLYGEHWSCWLSAERTVSEPATLPPAAHLGTMIKFDSLPPGATHSTPQSVLAGGAGSNGGGPMYPVVGGVVQVPMSPEQAFAARVAALRGRLLTVEQLGTIAPPEPIVEGWLFRDSLAQMIGPSRGMKTFVAVDIACSVATGRGWHGRIVKAGPAVYVVAEGAAGIKQRVDAWAQQTGLSPGGAGGLLLLPEPVQIMGPDWAAFVAMAAELRPALIVFDTRARVTVGRDENSAQDMGVIVEACEALRRATGACVLLVHHTGVNGGERGRGSGAAFGALTSELLIARTGMSVTVSCTKQKDVPEPGAIPLTAVAVAESLVLVGTHDVDRHGLMNPAPVATQDVGKVHKLTLISVLREWGAGTTGGTKAEIRGLYYAQDAVRGMSADARKRAFTRAWNELEKLGRLARNPEIGSRFQFAEIAGRADLDDNPDGLNDHGWPIERRGTDVDERPVRRTGVARRTRRDSGGTADKADMGQRHQAAVPPLSPDGLPGAETAGQG